MRLRRVSPPSGALCGDLRGLPTISQRHQRLVLGPRRGHRTEALDETSLCRIEHLFPALAVRKSVLEGRNRA